MRKPSFDTILRPVATYGSFVAANTLSMNKAIVTTNLSKSLHLSIEEELLLSEDDEEGIIIHRL